MIKLLDKNTIDKIAAGEVIERPSSVVKELLENSIDAEATSITVEIKDGGLSFIRVTDNGVGIPKEQVKTAYMRHATSKISDASDLDSIASLGFRGEALSTIAAVSQAEMITKTASALTGVKYVIHGGEEIEYKEVGVPDGTTIVVRNLFFNTPARKKFLKTPMTEGSYINDLVLKLALSHPEISFKLIINGQTKLDTSGSGKVKDVIYQLFGRDITSNLLEINYESDTIKISGYIGKPYISRGNRGLENYFINNRYIKSNIINRAIEEGYKTFVMQHKFPFTVMYIELPADKCDVNVHPTKMEFKYDNERELFEVVTKAVRDALSFKELIPKAEYENSKPKVIRSVEKPAEPFEVNRKEISKTEEKMPAPGSWATKAYTGNNAVYMPPKKQEANAQPIHKPVGEKYSASYNILEQMMKNSEDIPLEKHLESQLLQDEGVKYEPSSGSANMATNSKAINEFNTAENKTTDEKVTGNIAYGDQTSLFDSKFLSETARKKHRLIGQVFDTYWLIEYEDNLYIMDQHAAHEKVKYEELMAGLKNKEVYSQQIMPPMVITVSYAERQAIMDNFDLFIKLGYDIIEFGGNEFKINAVPANLYNLHGRTMFMEFVSSLIDNSGYMSNDVFIKKLSTMACKAAIKGNMRITASEADALIEQLLSLENPYTCPHGRPTIISMSERELEKKFKRVL